TGMLSGAPPKLPEVSPKGSLLPTFRTHSPPPRTPRRPGSSRPTAPDGARHRWRPSGSLLLSRGRDRLFGVCAGACRRQGRSSGGALHLDGVGASARGAGSRPDGGVRNDGVGG